MMLRLGFEVKNGESVELTLDERKQGTYIIGTTGTGKSTLLKNIIYQDMEKDRKHGLCVLDPHGDLIDELLLMVPEDRKKDVIFFNPMDMLIVNDKTLDSRMIFKYFFGPGAYDDRDVTLRESLP